MVRQKGLEDQKNSFLAFILLNKYHKTISITTKERKGKKEKEAEGHVFPVHSLLCNSCCTVCQVSLSFIVFHKSGSDCIAMNLNQTMYAT